jgi:excisionase family DNA binding protein
MTEGQTGGCDGVVLLRITDVAKMLGLGRSKAYAMAKQGALPVVRIGKAIRVPCQGLFEWVRTKTQQARV